MVELWPNNGRINPAAQRGSDDGERKATQVGAAPALYHVSHDKTAN